MSEQHVSAPRQHSGGGPPSREGRSGGPGGGGPGGPRRGKRQYFRKKKVCRFCVERVDFIDYKKVEMLQPFVQDRGKNHAPPHDRHLLTAPALAGSRHKAGA